MPSKKDSEDFNYMDSSLFTRKQNKLDKMLDDIDKKIPEEAKKTYDTIKAHYILKRLRNKK